jgi:hypothetical protein
MNAFFRLYLSVIVLSALLLQFISGSAAAAGLEKSDEIVERQSLRPFIAARDHIRLDGTRSPDGKYVFGWALSTSKVDYQKIVDHEKNTGKKDYNTLRDFPGCEIKNYIVGTDSGKKLLLIKDSNYAKCDGVWLNNRDIGFAWSDDSKWLVYDLKSKWKTDLLNFYVFTDGDKIKSYDLKKLLDRQVREYLKKHYADEYEKYGDKIGTIGYDVSRGKEKFNKPLILQTADPEEIDSFNEDLKEISYEGMVLKYYKEDGGFVNILTHTIQNGVWIRKSDLEKNKFKPQKWMDFLLAKKEFWYDNRVDLKKSPDQASRTIVRISGDNFEIIFTGKTKGQWAEVEVRKYRSVEEVGTENGKVIKKYEGWIRAIDKKGEPAVWFYTRGM